MNWLYKLCQENDFSKAYQYFDIGHGDYNKKVGFEPKYLVWVYTGGSIEVGPESEGTHGSLWSHEFSSRTYKGRYEPETGRLSIVKPSGREMYDVPEVVMDVLRWKFKNIGKISVF